MDHKHEAVEIDQIYEILQQTLNITINSDKVLLNYDTLPKLYAYFKYSVKQNK